ESCPHLPFPCSWSSFGLPSPRWKTQS
ncbi:uncharacterized protein METZ01_LOCUS198557, partial [marine metagenome]